jgi:hypothetical protein
VISILDAAVRGLAGRRLNVGLPLPPGVQVRRSRLIPWLGGRFAGMGRAAAAVTLGRTILVRPGLRPDDRLLRHELAHVAQWNRHPLTFPILYVRAHIRHGYHDNPYEIEARGAERPASETGDSG